MLLIEDDEMPSSLVRAAGAAIGPVSLGSSVPVIPMLSPVTCTLAPHTHMRSYNQPLPSPSSRCSCVLDVRVNDKPHERTELDRLTSCTCALESILRTVACKLGTNIRRRYRGVEYTMYHETNVIEAHLYNASN